MDTLLGRDGWKGRGRKRAVHLHGVLELHNKTVFARHFAYLTQPWVSAKCAAATQWIISE